MASRDQPNDFVPEPDNEDTPHAAVEPDDAREPAAALEPDAAAGPGGIDSPVSEGYQPASQRSRVCETPHSPEEPESRYTETRETETVDPFEAIREAEARRQEREKRLRERGLNVTESMLLEEIESYVEEERPATGDH